jgi:hypothetical protein
MILIDVNVKSGTTNGMTTPVKLSLIKKNKEPCL